MPVHKRTSSRLSHLRADGTAHMVDVSTKPATARTAVADGTVRMQPETLRILQAGEAKKGDVLGTARLAGIQAAKRTSELIPLCHPLALSQVTVDLSPDPALPGVRISARVSTVGPTGVEMEALTAVSVAALTVYDMLKAVDRAMVLGDISLQSKDGGRSGAYRRKRGRPSREGT